MFQTQEDKLMLDMQDKRRVREIEIKAKADKEKEVGAQHVGDVCCFLQRCMPHEDGTKDKRLVPDKERFRPYTR